jgi:sugar/nucleoside kinase (ribokinase family)
MRKSTSGAPGAPEAGQPQPVQVVGLGYCVYDILALVPRVPQFDDVEMAHVSDLVFDGGGPVGTALTAVSRLGERAGYVGLLGEDSEGFWLRDRFISDRVDVAHLRLSPAVGTNVCVILVDQRTAGRAFICHQRISSGDLRLDDDDREYIRSARILHLDGQFIPAAVQAAGWARDAGVKVSFDGNHPRHGLDRLLPLVDWLIVARPFPEAQTGLSNLDQAAAALLDRGPELLVVTDGESGCHVWAPGRHFHSPGFRVGARDTTGAGDAFHGAFLYAMLQGWGLRQTARFASAAAALNCLTLGGRRGLPSLQQVRTLLSTTPTVLESDS